MSRPLSNAEARLLVNNTLDLMELCLKEQAASYHAEAEANPHRLPLRHHALELQLEIALRKLVGVLAGPEAEARVQEILGGKPDEFVFSDGLRAHVAYITACQRPEPARRRAAA